ncbi:MAG: SIS domain-containing protein [Chloroflexi bacterium]|nr:SIS domain-containing protein [Chloroflexota bacterium]MCL5946927.1 SIS domain-containing protein [Chloroflexota bacterium]
MSEHDAYLQAVAQTLPLLSTNLIETLTDALYDTYTKGNTIFVCGNGGSAATASHFALDLCKGTRPPEPFPPVRAIALTDSVPLLTAWANDTAYNQVFQRQLTSWFRPDDLLFAISASGNSENVLLAAQWTAEHRGKVLALTGYTGGRLAPLAHYALIVPANDIELIEDCHSVLCHLLTRKLRMRIAARASSV